MRYAVAFIALVLLFAGLAVPAYAVVGDDVRGAREYGTPPNLAPVSSAARGRAVVLTHAGDSPRLQGQLKPSSADGLSPIFDVLAGAAAILALTPAYVAGRLHWWPASRSLP